MNRFGIGQAVSRFEDPRLVRGGGRYVDDIVLPGMAFGYVLRSPHAHARIRAIDVTAANAAPGVLAILTGADWRASGWGDLPVPWRPQAARRTSRLPAALPGARAGPRPLCRRCRRLRGGGDLPSGGRRRRADRGRLRSAAGGDLHRTAAGGRHAPGMGRLRQQHLLRPSRRRQGRNRRGLRPCRQVVRQISSSTGSPRRRWSRAAHRRLQAADGRYTIYTTCSAPIRSAPNSASKFSRCRRTRCGWSPAISAAASG